MDGSRFDAWTRRRFGLAAGGLAGALLGVAELDEADAKKRCQQKLGESCKPDSKRKCCKKDKGLQCRDDPPTDFRCCRKGGEPCTTSGPMSECCSLDCRNEECFCKPNGDPCGVDRHCCSGRCDTEDTFTCVKA